jgi:hypothetical protein
LWYASACWSTLNAFLLVSALSEGRENSYTFLLADENPKSIKLGATTWNAGPSFPPSTKKGSIFVTSRKHEGQPWRKRRGIASMT